MRTLGRCSEERLAFVLGEIFATAIGVKEISGYHLPLLSLGHAFPAWGSWGWRGPHSRAGQPFVWLSRGQGRLDAGWLLPAHMQGN